MGWTKRQFVLQAFEEIGYGSYVYDAQPDELESIRHTLDAMMANWNARGIRVGFPISSSPKDGDLDEQTNVPDSANEAIYLNLACRIGPRFGKQVSPDTKQFAKEALNSLLIKYCLPTEMSLPYFLPRGAGDKNRSFVYLTPAKDNLQPGNDSDLIFE